MRKWLLWSGGLVLVLVAGLGVAAWRISGRIEPYLREQTIAYLSKRFASEVDLAALDVAMPLVSPLDIALRGGRGAVVTVTGRGIELRHRGRRDFPPLFRMRRISFRADLYTVWNPPAVRGLSPSSGSTDAAAKSSSGVAPPAGLLVPQDLPARAE